MRFAVEPAPNGAWRVVLEGTDAPLSIHDTEEEARERLAAYARGAAAAAMPTADTGIARGERLTLPSGEEVIARPLAPEDRGLVVEAFEHRFGAESRYTRFLSPKGRLSTAELDHLIDVDHDTHEAIGVIDPATGRGIGVARFIRDRPGATSAEVAIALADEWQGQGLGWVLLRRLADSALQAGVTELTATLLAENRRMLALFGRLGRMEVRHDSGATVRLAVALAP